MQSIQLRYRLSRIQSRRLPVQEGTRPEFNSHHTLKSATTQLPKLSARDRHQRSVSEWTSSANLVGNGAKALSREWKATRWSFLFNYQVIPTLNGQQNVYMCSTRSFAGSMVFLMYNLFA